MTTENEAVTTAVTERRETTVRWVTRVAPEEPDRTSIFDGLCSSNPDENIATLTILYEIARSMKRGPGQDATADLGVLITTRNLRESEVLAFTRGEYDELILGFAAHPTFHVWGMARLVLTKSSRLIEKVAVVMKEGPTKQKRTAIQAGRLLDNFRRVRMGRMG